MTAFISLTPEDQGELILSAQQRVIYAAASITDSVVASLIKAYKHLGEESCITILDYDEQLFRMGYGHNEAVQMLLEEEVPIRKQSDLRIGVLIVDNQGWVFSLSPMAVEAQDQTSVINAVTLHESQLESMITSLVGEKDQTDIFGGELALGTELITEQEVEQVTQAIQANPPQAVDLERQVRVYQTHLQFVELEFEGGKIQQRTIRLPKELKEALFSQDKEIENRLNASYKLINGGVEDALAEIKEQFKQLRDHYAPSLGSRVGRVLLKSNKSKFDKAFNELKEKLETYRSESLQAIQGNIEHSLDDLAKNLAPIVEKNPPLDLHARCSIIDADIAKEYLLDTLRKVSPSAKNILEKTQLHCNYKDVTIEMLRDKEFQKKVAEEFQFEKWVKPFAEFGAAAEKV